MSAYTLITGASTGFGEAFAKELAARKKNLVLVARSEDKLRALAEALCKGHGIDARVFPQDLSTLNGAEQVFQFCQEEKFDIELLINNAGFGYIGEFDEQPLEAIEQMMLLNNLTAAKLARLFAPALVARAANADGRRGGMMNVASVAAFNAIPTFAVYAATKAFLLSLSEALNEELSPKGVTVTAICPGFTDTPFLGKVGQSRQRTLFPLEKTEIVVKTALRAFEQGKSVAITSGWYRAAIFAERFLPRRWAAKVARKVLKLSQEKK
ncbi:MAG: hypothetical protein HY22_03515 [[Candidatus Thermochlorobacteriaceae] bacterium GBChlB]|nr:MAG: hypothetical protein HY22_03515 [[Candidatus Thermochlorobacteriaceae] bacterium GBChlB]